MVEDHRSLRVARRHRVWEITLQRPELMNAFDEVSEMELTEVVRAAAVDAEVRALILLAEGRAFSAGGDFELMLRCNGDLTARLGALGRARALLEALHALHVPLVVGVQGAAVGLGASLVLAGDAVVASRNAKIADAHVSVGLAAGDGGVLFWPQSAGMLRARRYLLTGEAISAEQAFAFGLVTDLVDSPDEVAPEARAIALKVASLPPLAVQATKRALNQLTRQRAGEAVEGALLAEGHTLGSADLVEAISAFREKRTPEFVGR